MNEVELNKSLKAIADMAIKGSDDDKSLVLERLSHNLGFVISMLCGGNPEAIDTAVFGVEQYITNTAYELSPLAKLATSGK